MATVSVDYMYMTQAEGEQGAATSGPASYQLPEATAQEASNQPDPRAGTSTTLNPTAGNTAQRTTGGDPSQTDGGEHTDPANLPAAAQEPGVLHQGKPRWPSSEAPEAQEEQPGAKEQAHRPSGGPTVATAKAGPAIKS